MDHNWGHGRCQLILPGGDVDQYGPDISTALVAAVPAQFRGLDTAKLGPQDVPVGTIDSIYRDLFGFSTGHPPDTDEPHLDGFTATARELKDSAPATGMTIPNSTIPKLSTRRWSYFPTCALPCGRLLAGPKCRGEMNKCPTASASCSSCDSGWMRPARSKKH